MIPADIAALDGNPLLAPWTAPFGLPPFERIRTEHFAPALAEAMRLHRAELDAIAAQDEAPDFENTVAALDRSGLLLGRIDAVLSCLTASHTTPALQAVQRETAGPLAEHEAATRMHAGVFARLDVLHARRETLGLSPVQRTLLERLHLDAVRAGARLAPAHQQAHAQLLAELAELHTRFGQNVLADEAAWFMALPDEASRAGLPEFLRAAARQAAADRGLPAGSQVVTLNRSLIEPFLAFSERRDLREQAWRAWMARGTHPGPTDNREVARHILALRQQQARAHGHASYADYALADTMAGSPRAAHDLLAQVWQRALPAAERERQALVEEMRAAGAPGEPAAWDWRYWSEKVRARRFALAEAELKPYFVLDRMVEAMFDCAQRLFGVRFVRRSDLTGYHPDVCVWELFDARGDSAGLFLQDNFARPSKRSGAWMSSLVWQARNGGRQRPVILNNNNFARGEAGQPTLLSFDDARTLFHEFGHGLHGLLSDVDYLRQSGTQVLRDFVELPSQLFEHWLDEPEVLRRHARHWQTGEPIPDALVERLRAAARWGQGYATVSYCGSALVDLALHTRTEAEPPADLLRFEAETLRALGMPQAIGPRHGVAHFQHLFAGASYAAGYYVYLWAEVLEADAFQAFAEAGDAFDPALAERLRRCIYAVGGSVPPQQAYTDFRGRAAGIGPLLAQRGLAEPG
jgi:peptidyl-dipeptidase Dcp